MGEGSVISSAQKSAKPRRQRRRVAVDGPRPVDVHVGSRLRLRRTLLGISQEKLGESVNLTFQQIQKYERGANRIGASRLYEFSRILEISISYFFEDMPKEVSDSYKSDVKGLSDQIQEEMESDPMIRRETLELVRAYYKVSDTRVRKRLYELVKAVGNSADG